MSVVAGVGFRRETLPEQIVALVERALAEAGLERGRLARLATLTSLARASAFLEAAQHLGAVSTGIDAAHAAAQAGLRTWSERSYQAHGVGSVAEAAALAAAGPGAVLVLARISSAGATCALAQAVGEKL